MTLPPPINTPEVKEAMPDIIVSPEEVQVLLSQIKPGKAPGPNVSHHVSFMNFQKKLLKRSNLYSRLPLTAGNYPKIGYMRVYHSIQRWQ